MVCLDGILPMRCLANSIYLDMLSLVDDYGVRHLWRIKYGMECVRYQTASWGNTDGSGSGSGRSWFSGCPESGFDSRTNECIGINNEADMYFGYVRCDWPLRRFTVMRGYSERAVTRPQPPLDPPAGSTPRSPAIAATARRPRVSTCTRDRHPSRRDCCPAAPKWDPRNRRGKWRRCSAGL